MSVQYEAIRAPKVFDASCTANSCFKGSGFSDPLRTRLLHESKVMTETICSAVVQTNRLSTVKQFSARQY